MAEGIDVGYRMILVAPDNSIDFTALSSMSVVGALNSVQQYVADTPIPGWDGFVNWMNNNMGDYPGYASGATVCGKDAGRLPSWPRNPSQADVFAWFAQVALNAGCDSVAASGYMVGSNKISIPITVTAIGRTISLRVQMAI
jgi:hypothetical protein